MKREGEAKANATANIHMQYISVDVDFILKSNDEVSLIECEVCERVSECAFADAYLYVSFFFHSFFLRLHSGSPE